MAATALVLDPVLVDFVYHLVRKKNPPKHHPLTATKHGDVAGNFVSFIALATPADEPVKIPNLTTEQQEKALKAVAAATDTDKFHELLTEDIQKLTDTTNQIELVFQDIEDKLGVVDGYDIQGTEKFQPGWKTLHQRFRTSSAESKKQANVLAAFCDRYSTNYLPAFQGNDLSLDEKKELLKEMMDSEIAPNQKVADDVRKSFVQLSDDIHEYAQTFGTFATQRKADVGKDLENLNSQLVTKQAHLAKMLGIASAMGAALGVTIFGTATACVAFPLAMPFVIAIGAFLAAGEIAGLASTLALAAKDRDDINDIQSQINAKNRELETIAKAKQLLKTSQAETATLLNSLTLFTTIWTAFGADIESIKADLDAAKDKTAQIIFKMDIGSATKIYVKLKDALQLYVLNVKDV